MNLHILMPVFDSKGNENMECDAAYLNLDEDTASELFHIYLGLDFKNKKSDYVYEGYEPIFFNSRNVNKDTAYTFYDVFIQLFDPPGAIIIERGVPLKEYEIEPLETCEMHIQENYLFWIARSRRNENLLTTEKLDIDYLETGSGLYFEDYL